MCGIAGFSTLNQSGSAVEESVLAEMMRALRHRGPDAKGIWLSRDRKIGLGHTRLSILDLSPNGHQPMIGNDGSIIVYNGELYNFQELKQRFQGTSFRSTS